MSMEDATEVGSPALEAGWPRPSQQRQVGASEALQNGLGGLMLRKFDRPSRPIASVSPWSPSQTIIAATAPPAAKKVQEAQTSSSAEEIFASSEVPVLVSVFVPGANFYWF